MIGIHGAHSVSRSFEEEHVAELASVQRSMQRSDFDLESFYPQTSQVLADAASLLTLKLN